MISDDTNKNHVIKEKAQLEDHPHSKNLNIKAAQTQQELATAGMEPKQR